MSWTMACALLSKGKKVRRACWAGGRYIQITAFGLQLRAHYAPAPVPWMEHSTHLRALDWEIAA